MQPMQQKQLLQAAEANSSNNRKTRQVRAWAAAGVRLFMPAIAVSLEFPPPGRNCIKQFILHLRFMILGY